MKHILEYIDELEYRLDDAECEEDAKDISNEFFGIAQDIKNLRRAIANNDAMNALDNDLEELEALADEKAGHALVISEEIYRQEQEIKAYGSYEQQHALTMRDVL